MLENIIRNNPDAVLICDRENLKFLEVNDAAVNLYGYRMDEFLQMDLTDLYLTEDIQLLLESSSANIRGGAFHGPYKHKKKDGSILFVEISRFPVKFQEHEAHFNIIRNVTEKLESEKKNQSFKYVFDNTDDLIFITDSSGFIRFVNQQVIKILGFTKDELINSAFASLVSDEDRSRINQSFFHSSRVEISSLTLNLKTLSGRFLIADVLVSPVLGFNKEVESFTLIGKVKQLPMVSSDEIGGKHDMGDSHINSNQKLDSKLLAGLFHEILTHINVILGFAQEITDSVVKPTAEQRDATIIIKQNRSNLLQTMNAAIEFATLSDRELNILPAETKITDIIDQLLKDTDELKSTLDVEFAYGKISSSLKFETDRQRFKYFLLLLFEITAKLSGQKKIYFSAYAQDREHFLITFKDLQTHCSRLLVNQLQNLFNSREVVAGKEFEVLKITMLLTQKLLKILKGRFVIISDEKDKNDYGIIFPIKYGDLLSEEERPAAAEKPEDGSGMEMKADSGIKVSQSQVDEKLKAKLNRHEELAALLQNELKIEALRQKIRNKEAQKKTKKTEKEGDNTAEDSSEDKLIEDTVEYIDVDLQESLEDQITEEELEIIETSAPRKKTPQSKQVKHSDEKVDISNLSCLYIEDQIDSQVLFSIQMKGLKSLNFSISFEESLPLLDSGNFDFIVIDINLQGSYNGLDLLRIIRSMPRYENTPVFAVTAYVLPGDQQKFVLAGFNGFISKPVFRDQVIDTLAEVFKEPKNS